MSEPPDTPRPAAPPAERAPPTEPGPIPLRPRGQTWPTALGIACIVVGGLGTLANAWGALSPLFMGVMARLPGPGGASVAAMQRYTPLVVTHALLAVALAVVLLVGGIALISGRPWSRPLLLTWAALKSLLVPAGAAITYLMQQAQLQAMQNDPQFGGSAAAAAAMSGMAIVSVFFSLAWGWALPLFLLIWLLRAPIREQVRAWK